MAGKIRIRATLQGETVEVKALMQHPMETGRRKDSEGKSIPANFITEVGASVNDRVVIQGMWGAAVSQNPFLAFRFTGAKAGDVVKVYWTDNLGNTGQGEAAIR